MHLLAATGARHLTRPDSHPFTSDCGLRPSAPGPIRTDSGHEPFPAIAAYSVIASLWPSSACSSTRSTPREACKRRRDADDGFTCVWGGWVTGQCVQLVPVFPFPGLRPLLRASVFFTRDLSVGGRSVSSGQLDRFMRSRAFRLEPPDSSDPHKVRLE